MKTTGHMLLDRSIEKNENMETFKSELELERMKLETPSIGNYPASIGSPDSGPSTLNEINDFKLSNRE